MTHHTLDTLRLRCDDVGDCWEWRGALGGAGTRHPTVRHAGKPWLVRRLVATLAGTAPQPKQKVMPSCENPRCINPEHLRLQTHQRVMKRQGALGKLSEPARLAKIASTKRARYGKLTMQDARDIRASTDTARQIAERYGIHQRMVFGIRQHRRWRELEGNPFLGLGQRK